MENQNPESEKSGGCLCSKSCSSGNRCCVCKALCAIVLLLIGGAGGYCIARRCHKTSMCPMASMPAASAPAPMTAPAVKK